MYRKQIALITLILGVMFVLSVTSTQVITLQKCESYVSIKDNKAYEKLILTYIVPYSIDYNGTKGVWYNDSIGVYGNPLNIKVIDSKRNLTYTIKKDNESDETRINYEFGSVLMEGDRYTIIITFDRDLEKPADNYAYILAYRWNNAPLHLNVLLRFSEKYEYYSSLPTNLPDAIFFDEDYLMLHWIDYSTPRFLTRVTFGVLDELMNVSPIENNKTIHTLENKTENKRNISGVGILEENITDKEKHDLEDVGFIDRNLLLIIGIFILIIFAIFFVKKIKKRRDEMEKEKAEREAHSFAARKLEETLTPIELSIVEELRIENNLTQTELCRRTGIAKSTMSRTLDRLERKEIIERIGEGMSKRVRLVNWMMSE